MFSESQLHTYMPSDAQGREGMSVGRRPLGLRIRGKPAALRPQTKAIPDTLVLKAKKRQSINNP